MTNQILAKIFDQMEQMQPSFNEMNQIKSKQGVKDEVRSLFHAMQDGIMSLGNRFTTI